MHSFLNLTTLLHYHHTIELTCTKRILTLCKFFLFSSCRPPKFSRLSKRGRPEPNIKQTHSHGCFNHSFTQKTTYWDNPVASLKSCLISDLSSASLVFFDPFCINYTKNVTFQIGLLMKTFFCILPSSTGLASLIATGRWRRRRTSEERPQSRDL